jgi:hypothetical protein
VWGSAADLQNRRKFKVFARYKECQAVCLQHRDSMNSVITKHVVILLDHEDNGRTADNCEYVAFCAGVLCCTVNQTVKPERKHNYWIGATNGLPYRPSTVGNSSIT